jgi:hypothetical protein
MKASSTKSKGYLIYLKESAKEYLENNQPSTVITLADIESILKNESNKDSDEDSDAGIDNKRSKIRKQVASKQLLSRAKEIMNASKAVMKNIEDASYATHKGSEFNYKARVFNTKECEFFEQNRTLEGVFNSYIDKYRKLPALFEWIPKSVLTDAQIQRRELKRLETERYMLLL